MDATDPTVALVEALPAVAAGGLTVRVFDAEGRERSCAGPADSIRVEAGGGEPRIEAAAGRRAVYRPLGRSGWFAVASFDAGRHGELEPFLDSLFDMLDEKERAEADMESINSSSLALLEEVSMVGDTLPSLPTCSTEIEIAEMGLKAVVVAASVNRALFVQYDEATGHAEVLVQVGIDESGRRALPMPYAGQPALPPGEGLVWRAIEGCGDAILESVPEGGGLGAPGSPESLAEREVIAVPVAYGSEEKRVVLGALLMLDKRANAYSDSVQLGSQETKLATTVAAMLGSVLGTRKVTELGKELRMANEIQQQILPHRAADVAGFDLAGRCSTSGAVGGDYFDFIPMDDGRTMVVVADVSGHNLASGMIMVSARSALRVLASKLTEPGLVFDSLAEALYPDLTRTERFITAVGAAVTPGTREVELCNAGHNDSMLYRARTGEVERLPSSDTVFGFLPEPEHETRRIAMEPGDVLLLYTDGVVEATDAAGEMLGEERLVEIYARVAGGSAEEILNAVFTAVEEFGVDMRADDVTAVVVKAVHTEAGAA